jgi:hypothetical protein
MFGIATGEGLGAVTAAIFWLKTRECQYFAGGNPNAIMAVPDDGFRFTKGAPASLVKRDFRSPSTTPKSPHRARLGPGSPELAWPEVVVRVLVDAADHLHRHGGPIGGSIFLLAVHARGRRHIPQREPRPAPGRAVSPRAVDDADVMQRHLTGFQLDGRRHAFVDEIQADLVVKCGIHVIGKVMLLIVLAM